MFTKIIVEHEILATPVVCKDAEGYCNYLRTDPEGSTTMLYQCTLFNEPLVHISTKIDYIPRKCMQCQQTLDTQITLEYEHA